MRPLQGQGWLGVMPAWVTSRVLGKCRGVEGERSARGASGSSKTGTPRPGRGRSPVGPKPWHALPDRDPAPSPARVPPPTDPGSAPKARRAPTHLVAGAWDSSSRKCEAERRHPPGELLPEAAEGGAGRGWGRGGAGPRALCGDPVQRALALLHGLLPAPRAEQGLGLWLFVSWVPPGSRPGAPVPPADPCAPLAARKPSAAYKLSIYFLQASAGQPWKH